MCSTRGGNCFCLTSKARYNKLCALISADKYAGLVMKYLSLLFAVDCVELNVLNLTQVNHIRQKNTTHQADRRPRKEFYYM